MTAPQVGERFVHRSAWAWHDGEQRGEHVIEVLAEVTERKGDHLSWEQVEALSEEGRPPSALQARSAPQRGGIWVPAWDSLLADGSVRGL